MMFSINTHGMLSLINFHLDYSLFMVKMWDLGFILPKLKF